MLGGKLFPFLRRASLLTRELASIQQHPAWQQYDRGLSSASTSADEGAASISEDDERSGQDERSGHDPQPFRGVGVCVLERLPLVVPDLPDWEWEYREWQRERNERYKKVLPPEITQPDSARASGGEALGGWEPAPEITEADLKGDTRSLHRALTNRLFLILKIKLTTEEGQEGEYWQFPSVVHMPGETMRQTAERALANAVEPMDPATWQTWMVGNAPSAHFDPPGDFGTLFFYRMQLIKGEPRPIPGTPYTDYAWVTKEELRDRMPFPGLTETLHFMLSP